MEKPNLLEQYRPLLPWMFGGMILFPCAVVGAVLGGIIGFLVVIFIAMVILGLAGLSWYFDE